MISSQRTSPDERPTASIFPSGLNERLVVPFVPCACPLSVLNVLLEATSQSSITGPSKSPEASVLPSGLNATPQT